MTFYLKCHSSTGVFQTFCELVKSIVKSTILVAECTILFKESQANTQPIFQGSNICFPTGTNTFHTEILFLSQWKKRKQLKACNLIKKENPTQVLSCELCKIFKTIFLLDISGGCFWHEETYEVILFLIYSAIISWTYLKTCLSFS